MQKSKNIKLKKKTLFSSYVISWYLDLPIKKITSNTNFILLFKIIIKIYFVFMVTLYYTPFTNKFVTQKKKKNTLHTYYKLKHNFIYVRPLYQSLIGLFFHLLFFFFFIFFRRRAFHNISWVSG